ncbi:MAG: DMT family transporter [Alphaproteobacteria bacterium]
MPTVLPEIIAIFSSMGWAGDSILVRLGTRKSSIFAAMFMSFLVSATCVWSYLLATTPLDFLSSPAMIYFLISGCLQPLCARALFYEGLTRIGVSRAGPLRGAEPFFAAAIAVAFLHERPGVAVYSGTVLIVASVWVVSGIHGGERKWRLLDSAFPLGAALVSAVSQSLRKQGLNILPNPFIAAVTVTSTSLVLLSVFLWSTNRIRVLHMERGSFFYFLGAAAIATIAQVLNFIALGRGQVSAIIPLLNTTPLFILVFSKIFLRGVERVTLRIVLGAILMVSGVVLITSR